MLRDISPLARHWLHATAPQFEASFQAIGFVRLGVRQAGVTGFCGVTTGVTGSCSIVCVPPSAIARSRAHSDSVRGRSEIIQTKTGSCRLLRGGPKSPQRALTVPDVIENFGRYKVGACSVSVYAAPIGSFEVSAPVVIVGAGAAGLCAALSAHESGVDVVVVERDSLPRGSTVDPGGRYALSAISRRQRQCRAICRRYPAQSSRRTRRYHHRHDRRESGTTEWLASRYSFPFSLVSDFSLPRPFCPAHARAAELLGRRID